MPPGTELVLAYSRHIGHVGRAIGTRGISGGSLRSMTDQIRERWRRRSLGSDRRAGSWAAGEARRRQLRLLRQSWGFFVIFLFLGGAVIAGVALTLDNDFLRGFVVGAGSIAVLGGTAVMVPMLSGTAATAMGETAEQWTASELRPLRKRGWFVVNHFLLRRHDIDHVLVGPNGVVAVEDGRYAGAMAGRALKRAVSRKP